MPKIQFGLLVTQARAGVNPNEIITDIAPILKTKNFAAHFINVILQPIFASYVIYF